jgi:hypothetical protein
MDIKTYLNVLNKKERSAILKLVDKKLTAIPDHAGRFFPGLQTYANLHHNKELKPLIKKLKEYITGNFTVDKCWANYTDGGYVNWHTHKSDLSVVYYLKNEESIGTIFCINNKKIHLKGLQNSLIIFKNELHSVPFKKRGAPKINRYSIACELSFKM